MVRWVLIKMQKNSNHKRFCWWNRDNIKNYIWLNQWKEDKKQKVEMPFHIFFDKNTGQVLDLLLCSNMWTVDDVGMLFFSKDMGPQYVLNVLHLYMVVEFISLVTSFMHFIYNELLKIFCFHTISFVCFHTISFASSLHFDL